MTSEAKAITIVSKFNQQEFSDMVAEEVTKHQLAGYVVEIQYSTSVVEMGMGKAQRVVHSAMIVARQKDEEQ